MMFRIAILAAFLVGNSTPVTAAQLWQQADSGMTVQQVQSAFPAASVPQKKATLGNGASCELSIDVFVVASDAYNVCFYFRSAKLTQVTLGASDPNRPQFDTVVDLLRAKYGPELGAGTGLCKLGTLTICKADWVLKSGTNVSVIFMQVGRNSPLINVNYQTRIASEASKL
ncbi:MAG: hypothetical protein ABIU10_09915 [Sphingomicrobium sp.]